MATESKAETGGPEERQIDVCGLLLRADVTLSEAFRPEPPHEDLASISWHRLFSASLAGRPQRVGLPDDDADIHLGILRRPVLTPRWHELMSAAGVQLTVRQDVQRDGVIIATKVSATAGDRWVLWCFGGTSISVPKSLTDNRFGLIAALNKHEAGTKAPSWKAPPKTTSRSGRTGDQRGKVRGVALQARDGYPHRSTTRSTGPAPIEGLRFDSMSDLLRSLSLRTQDDMMGDIEGGRALRFSTYLESLHDLLTLSRYVLDLREMDCYRGQWDWVENIVPVQDQAEEDDVLHELFDTIVGDPAANVDVLLPPIESLETGDAQRLRYALPNERPAIRTPFTWSGLRSWLLAQADQPGTAVLKRNIRFALEGYENQPNFAIPILDTLVAEIDMDGAHYVLSDGEVLRVDKTFLETLNEQLLASALHTTFPFPTYQGGSEGNYLKRAHGRSNERLLMVDGANIKIPGETSFEGCDLLSDDGRLIFGKIKGKSATFSHLCTQAENAAELFVQSSEAREIFAHTVAKLDSGDRFARQARRMTEALANGKRSQVTVTLLILGSWRNRSVTTLPLVSRIRLRRTAQR